MHTYIATKLRIFYAIKPGPGSYGLSIGDYKHTLEEVGVDTENM